MVLRFSPRRIILGMFTLAWTLSCPGQVLPQSGSDPQLLAPSAAQPQSGQQAPGSISGTVIDQTGAVVPGASVQLAQDQSPSRKVRSGDDGQFSFDNVSPGAFHLAIASAGFATLTFSGVLQSGEIQRVPPVVLSIAAIQTTVQVGLSPAEVAQEQVKAEEKQRVLGIVPDFYVSYVPNAAPLGSRQKFNLAWRSATDPFTFVFAGGVAGVQQAQNAFQPYGQEIEGYAKRYGAIYADTASATFIGDAILPSLLKQDPRYFYKGTGSKRSRILYAMANSVICKGDNGHWQPNYSRVLGHLAAAGISNLYYPAKDRHGLGLTLETGAIGIGGSAIANLFQEFVVRKFTRKVQLQDPEYP